MSESEIMKRPKNMRLPFLEELLTNRPSSQEGRKSGQKGITYRRRGSSRG
jgi:hypothetical protein